MTGDQREALYAPHRRGGRFFNPWNPGLPRFRDLLRWRLRGRPPRVPGPLEVPVIAEDGARLRRAAETPELTWIGHASFALHEGDEVVLFDPHFGPRALVPPRLSPPGFPLEAVPANSIALLSHSHYDHLDDFTLARLPRSVVWFVPLGLGRHLRRFGFANVTELDWWQEAQHGRFTLTCLPAQHWSRRLGQPANLTLWCSWLMASERLRLFFAGDTGYFSGFTEFARRFSPIDTAILPIGAYEPRWFMRYQHLDPTEAHQAFLDLGARKMVAMHWGAFDLTDERPDEAPRELARVLAARGTETTSRVLIPAVGETVALK